MGIGVASMPGFCRDTMRWDGEEVEPPLGEGAAILDVQIVKHPLDRTRLHRGADLADIVGAAVTTLGLADELLEARATRRVASRRS